MNDRPQFTLSRSAWMVCACLLLLPYPAAAEPLLATVRTSSPLLRIVAADLGGDHRPEFVAHDSESMVHVWTRHHTRFQSCRARVAFQFTLVPPHRHSVNDDSEDGEAPDEPIT